MATATKKGRATLAANSGRGASELAVLEFLVRQDNGGGYQWEIVGERGESLAHSGDFTSYEAAERAARCVHESAGSARFAAQSGAEPKLALA